MINPQFSQISQNTGISNRMTNAFGDGLGASKLDGEGKDAFASELDATFNKSLLQTPAGAAKADDLPAVLKQLLKEGLKKPDQAITGEDLAKALKQGSVKIPPEIQKALTAKELDQDDLRVLATLASALQQNPGNVFDRLPQLQGEATTVENAGSQKGESKTAKVAPEISGTRSVQKDAGPSLMKEVSLNNSDRNEPQVQARSGWEQTLVSAESMPVQIEGIEVDKVGLDPVGQSKDSDDVSRAQGPQVLSGAEYLETRNAVRGVQQGRSGQKGSSDSKDDRAAVGRDALVEPAGGSLRTPDTSAWMSPQVGTESQMGLHAQPTWQTSTRSVEVSGRVTQGAMSQDRLNTESIGHLSSSIANLKQGGGEIRLRLNPEHLGEIRLRVSTRGEDVGLRIETAKPEAQRILQESLSSLRDSLSQHKLTLAQVDVGVSSQLGQQASYGNGTGSHAGMNSGGHNPWNSGGSSGDLSSFDQRSSRQERSSSDRAYDVRAEIQGAMPKSFPRPASRMASAGRIDLMA